MHASKWSGAICGFCDLHTADWSAILILNKPSQKLRKPSQFLPWGSAQHFSVIKTLEFFLNKFHWIQRLPWIITKSKSGKVTRAITHRAINTLSVVVIQVHFHYYLWVGRYLLALTTLNRYQPTDNSGKLFYHYIKECIYCQI